MMRIRQLHVVVPAHDEEELLPRCLAAIEQAVAQVRRRTQPPHVEVTVVLDACTDGSAAKTSRRMPPTPVVAP